MKRATLLAVVAGFAAFSPLAARAQTAAAIADQARARWEQRLQNVRSVTVTQQAVGAEQVIYSERVPGTPSSWRTKVWVRQPDGSLRPSRMPAAPFAAQQVRVLRENASSFTLEAPQTVDGKAVKVLALDGAAAGTEMVPGMPLGGSASEVRGARARYFLDATELVPLRAEITFGGPNAANPLKVVIGFADYRPVGGLLLPYRVSLAPEGQESGGAIQITVKDVTVNTPAPAQSGEWH
jgi:hypothetical protein